MMLHDFRSNKALIEKQMVGTGPFDGGVEVLDATEREVAAPWPAPHVYAPRM